MSDELLLELSRCRATRGSCEVYTNWADGGSVLKSIKLKKMCKYHFEKYGGEDASR
jgi:hypothetical protein